MNDAVVLARPMFAHKLDVSDIWFIKCRIVNNKHTSVGVNKMSDFIPKAVRGRFKAFEQTSVGVVGDMRM